ncbi:hypothetical protein PAMP_013789 [Pampus punctatissimus]
MTSPGSLTDSQLTSCHQLLSYNKLTFQNYWNRPRENGTSETRTDMRRLSIDTVYYRPCPVLSDPLAQCLSFSLQLLFTAEAFTQQTTKKKQGFVPVLMRHPRIRNTAAFREKLNHQ